jgi:prolyl-tRNA synthetase
MIARASQLFLPTLRADPADAEAASHKLLVRGGFIRQVGAGLWTFLPLGWRVHQKVAEIIRHELNAFGAQEMLAPVLTPAELWERSGRISIDILFHLQDSGGRPFILPMSHEESFSFHALELQSYKQLPQVWYHFQTKDRDEPRPKGGLLRVREFIMKDSYSFDRDAEGLDRSFELHSRAYHRIFERCGLRFQEVLAESGEMGGDVSRDFLAPAGSGENTLVTCERGDYAADIEKAGGIPRAPDYPEHLDAPEEIETPGVETIEALADLLEIDEAATSKAMPVVKPDGSVVLALIRGDDRLDEGKLLSALGTASRTATAEEIRQAFGAGGGSLGPVGVELEIVADETLRAGQYVAGANLDGRHLRGVEAGRDYAPRFADIRQVRQGDACPKCGGTLTFQTAIEIGHIFKLDTFYATSFGMNYLDVDGQERPIVMGSYGIGIGRTIAAIVEQHHDENGIIWPRDLAPYDVHVVALTGLEDQGAAAAQALDAAGHDVLLDDRDLRPGEKFADADLIGCPTRVTVGRKTLEDGAVDVRDRATGDEQRVELERVSEGVPG